MGGGKDDYNTTLQAVAIADIVQKSKLPVMILLSGGTNSKTAELAKKCGVRFNGVSIGTFARKLIYEYIKSDDFESNEKLIKKAVDVAEKLVKDNRG